MAMDKYGYKTLCLTITEQGKRKDIPLVSYHYEENDSYAYINHGDMKEIVVDFESIVNEDLIKFMLNKLNLTDDIRYVLTSVCL